MRYTTVADKARTEGERGPYSTVQALWDAIYGAAREILAGPDGALQRRQYARRARQAGSQSETIYEAEARGLEEAFWTLYDWVHVCGPAELAQELKALLRRYEQERQGQAMQD